MRFAFRRKWLAAVLATSVTVSAPSCIPSSDTISSLTDLAASTTGGLIQILVKAGINALVASLTPPNLAAAISSQIH